MRFGELFYLVVFGIISVAGITFLGIFSQTYASPTGNQVDIDISVDEIEIYIAPEVSAEQEECLRKCELGFNNCLHRSQSDDKKTKKCYSSRKRCVQLKCEKV